MPANYSLNPDLESYLTPAVSLRYVAEWSGLSPSLHLDYEGHIKDLAESLLYMCHPADPGSTTSEAQAIDQWPGEIATLDAFGSAFRAYAELVRLDVKSYLSDGTIPMKPLSEWAAEGVYI